MPSYRLGTALDQLATYVRDVGDTVQELDAEFTTIVTADGTEYELRGHKCTTEDSTYLVVGSESLRSAFVLYPYNVESGVADELTESAATEIVASADGDDSASAAEILLRRELDDQQVSDIEYRLQRLSAGTMCDVQVFSGLTSFMIDAPVFPYEQTFSIDQFSEAKRRVVTLGETAQTAVERAVSVDVDTDDPASTRLRVDPSRI